MVKVGIIGVGTVGASVVKILEQNKDIIRARAGKEIRVVKGVVKDLSKKRGVEIPLSVDADEILDDPQIDIVVELMGGVEEAYRVVKKAIDNKKSVVTANKALLAYHRYDLQESAKELPIAFEASVAGGIPIIRALREGLSANHIMSIKGILNGTCNFILTKMMNEEADFGETLKEAQKLGYAEADPTFDVGGFDTAHKLLVLASIAYGIDAKPEDILIEGIEKISSEDIFFAKEFGYKIKLLAVAKKDGDRVELRVHPALIDENKMIAKVDGVMNGVSVNGDFVGETMYYGAGAGGDATASAVVSDLIEIAREGKASPMLGFKKPLENNSLKLKNKDDLESEYYIRMRALDRPGILAKIAKTLGDHGISISAFLQNPKKDVSGYACLMFTTDGCSEINIKNAIATIMGFDFMYEPPFMIRIDS